MKRFVSFDGVQIAYQEWGRLDGGYPPVLLHHGFIAHAASNWVDTGVVDALVGAGRRVVALDARGHGSSDKPRDPRKYGEEVMSRDLTSLLDLVGSAVVDLVGYSMGGVVAAIAATRDTRIRRLVIGGVGASLVEQGGLDARAAPPEAVAAVLLEDDPDTIAASPVLRFRILADVLGSDRAALAAAVRCARAGSIPVARIAAPTLVLCGRDDPLATRPEVLAAAIPSARVTVLPGDHLRVLRNPGFASAIVDFVGRADGPA